MINEEKVEFVQGDYSPIVPKPPAGEAIEQIVPDAIRKAEIERIKTIGQTITRDEVVTETEYSVSVPDAAEQIASIRSQFQT